MMRLKVIAIWNDTSNSTFCSHLIVIALLQFGDIVFSSNLSIVTPLTAKKRILTIEYYYNKYASASRIGNYIISD